MERLERSHFRSVDVAALLLANVSQVGDGDWQTKSLTPLFWRDSRFSYRDSPRARDHRLPLYSHESQRFERSIRDDVQPCGMSPREGLVDAWSSCRTVSRANSCPMLRTLHPCFRIIYISSSDNIFSSVRKRLQFLCNKVRILFIYTFVYFCILYTFATARFLKMKIKYTERSSVMINED